MNRIHDWYCKSDRWNDLMVRGVLPEVLEGVALDGAVLEIGPGPGLVSKALLAYGVEQLTSVEIDDAAADRLREQFGDSVTVHTGDASAMPMEANQFDTIVCCTMLHHVPTVERRGGVVGRLVRGAAPLRARRSPTPPPVTGPRRPRAATPSIKSVAGPFGVGADC